MIFRVIPYCFDTPYVYVRIPLISFYNHSVFKCIVSFWVSSKCFMLIKEAASCWLEVQRRGKSASPPRTACFNQSIRSAKTWNSYRQAFLWQSPRRLRTPQALYPYTNTSEAIVMEGCDSTTTKKFKNHKTNRCDHRRHDAPQSPKRWRHHHGGKFRVSSHLLSPQFNVDSMPCRPR